MDLQELIMKTVVNGENFSPEVSKSRNYKHWISIPDEKRCVVCKDSHGKVYYAEEIPKPIPLVHPFCRCKIVTMDSIKAGTATKNGLDGVDWWIKYDNKLPNYYVDYNDALKKGWIPNQGNLAEVMPNTMICGGIYRNKNGHLPSVTGRVWYEADINYKSGFRGDCRVVWSNDGLIFVTYDHYRTFYEIV